CENFINVRAVPISMTQVYRSAIKHDHVPALPLPAAVRNGIVLQASLSTERVDAEDCWNDQVHVTVDVQRRRDETYRFLIQAYQADLEIAGYEVLSRAEIDAQLK